MPRPALLVLVSALLFSLPGNAQTTAPATTPATREASTNRLPVKKVVLYKNGVGYFEHTTRVRGTQELNIDFTTAQLNDVLKSLTVLDLGEGRISNVRYNSVAPLAERLRGLRLPLGEATSQQDFLNALRGARLSAQTGARAATGKLLSVESRKKPGTKGEDPTEVTEIALVTDSGEVNTFELGPGTTVRIAERDMNEEIGQYMNLLASARSQDVRRMTITAAGDKDREILVSYISEVPVWKSTYRLIMPDKSGEKPLLQGWAIVDNTIGEDWNDVHLSLVAGAPQSFVQQISKPYYVRRPVVEMPESMTFTPQTHESEFNRLDLYSRISPGGVGSGAGYGSGGAMAEAVPPPPASRAMPMMITEEAREKSAPSFYTVEAIRAKSRSDAEAKPMGDLFEYNVKQNVTQRKNESSLVPILLGSISAEKVTMWNEDSDRPLRGLWVTNSTGMTLDGGTFNVMDGGAFAGEGLLDILHPDEKRLISYAADLAVKVDKEEDSNDKPITRISINKGSMLTTREERETATYVIRNSDTSSRQVVVEHAARDEWEITSEAKPVETSASFHRFLVKVDPGKSAKLVVTERHPLVTGIRLTNLDDRNVGLIIEQTKASPEIEQALRRFAAQRNVIADLNRRTKAAQDETQSISSDQDRLRENMKALKGSAEEKTLLQRYVRQLDTQEDRIAGLRTEIEGLEKKRDAAQAELDITLADMTLDVTL